MPRVKQASKRQRVTKAVPVLGAAGLSLSLAAQRESAGPPHERGRWFSIPRQPLPAAACLPTWRSIPWPSDRLNDVSEARERQETLARWAERYGRV